MGIIEKIKEIEAEMARTQENNYRCFALSIACTYPLATNQGTSGVGDGFETIKYGHGQIAVIGFPSDGKSTLLTMLTGTHSEAASYEGVVDRYTLRRKKLEEFLSIAPRYVIGIDDVDKLACHLSANLIVISCNLNLNLDRLLPKMWKDMNLVRIYTKPQGQHLDFTGPVVLSADRGGFSVDDFCNHIHRSLVKEVKYVLVWGTKEVIIAIVELHLTRSLFLIDSDFHNRICSSSEFSKDFVVCYILWTRTKGLMLLVRLAGSKAVMPILNVHKLVTSSAAKEIQDSGLVCSSNCNIETLKQTSFQCYLILLPSDKGLMLPGRLAGSEEVMPTLGVNQLITSSAAKEIEDSMEARVYNPALHERGYHQKLNILVKESLQFGCKQQRKESEINYRRCPALQRP
ncbi:hypothetical protein POM88_051345 [Heracleum sosnowskyi]|uniref:TGS domain-containing protein n=1 Tax=Heracleum sosnowskyi TaxID=360622 RepID=A0AAD8H098_9APIA|nr:hypothetical protein POM88_051345 [Heracleum sosnowskyi]